MAQQYLAGSAFCRIRVPDVKSLYDEYQAAGVMHPHGPFRQLEIARIGDDTQAYVPDDRMVFNQPSCEEPVCPP